MTVNSYTPELSGNWDLQIGADGNLRMLSGTAGIVQNVACAGKSFKGGLYFFAETGIDWFTDALAQKFRRPIIAARLREAAESVQGVQAVETVKVADMDTESRTVSGEIIIETLEGQNGKAVL